MTDVGTDAGGLMAVPVAIGLVGRGRECGNFLDLLGVVAMCGVVVGVGLRGN